MRKLLSFLIILMAGMFCSACLNNIAVHKLNTVASECLNKNDYKCAISRLEASCDLDPNVYETRYNLAVAYIKDNQCDKALAEIESARQISPNETSLEYLSAVANDCLAEKEIYSFSDDIKEKIEFETDIQKQQAEEKYISYLQQANQHYENYLKQISNSDEIQKIEQQINQNNSAIEAIRSDNDGD